MRIHSSTDIGNVRSENQDFSGYKQFDEKTVFAVLCDGLGGYGGGQLASRIATDYMVENVGENYFRQMKIESVERMILTAAENASSRICERAALDEKNSKMATTVVGLFIRDGEGIAFNSGDSRCYRYSPSEGKFELISKDHSLYQQYLDRYGADYFKTHESPSKNIITSALGASNSFKIDSYATDVRVGDVFLLCSDGVTNEVDDETIKKILSSDSTDKSSELVAKAKENGGRDNITAVVISV